MISLLLVLSNESACGSGAHAFIRENHKPKSKSDSGGGRLKHSRAKFKSDSVGGVFSATFLRKGEGREKPRTIAIVRATPHSGLRRDYFVGF